VVNIVFLTDLGLASQDSEEEELEEDSEDDLNWEVLWIHTFVL